MLPVLWHVSEVLALSCLCRDGVGSASPTDSSSLHFYVMSPVFNAKKEKFAKNKLCGSSWLEIC